jgi:hypothetical protein
MPPAPPMLSRAVMPVTRLRDPPSMATPMSKLLTVPFRTVTPMRLGTYTPARSATDAVPKIRCPFRSIVIPLAPTMSP